jgi:iron complex transport system substrate-binding protein
VGRTEYDDPALRDIPSVGGTIDPSIERIVALKPDLVISWEDYEAPGIALQLDRLRIPVLGVQVGTIAGVKTAVQQLAVRLGIERAGDSAVAALDAILDSLTTGVRRNPPSVFFVVQLDPPMTAGPGTFIEELIVAAGGRNVFHDAQVLWPAISLESLVRRDPDVVIWPRASGAGPWENDIAGRPGWQQLSAVKNRRVLVVNRDLFNRPGPRLGEMARLLSQAFDSLAR